MSAGVVKVAGLESVLAGLLEYGTWVASAVTAVGVVLLLIAGVSGTHALALRVVAAGCGCFILLPVLRVAVMLVAYVRERDYRFVAVTATVLLIILAGLLVGMHMAKTR